MTVIERERCIRSTYLRGKQTATQGLLGMVPLKGVALDINTFIMFGSNIIYYRYRIDLF